MLKNCLAAALRHLAHSRLHSAINVLGLAAALAAVMLIVIYVRHERGFEHFLPGYEDTYRLSAASLQGGSADNATDDMRGPVAEQLRAFFPEVLQVTELRNTFSNTSLRRGNVDSLEPTFTWADPQVFEVLPFPVAAGDAKAALARPDGLVLTRRMARKYFGKELPLGETIEVDRERTLRVMAVLEDLPSSTHLATEMFGSTKALPPTQPGFVYRTYVYLRLRPGASAETMRARLPAFLDRTSPVASGTKLSSLLELPLVPIADVHLRPAGALNMKPAGDPRLLDALRAVGALILAVAVINFVNLMTARGVRRSVEIGVRKTAGAHRSDILLQFIGEAVLQVVIAVLIAVAVVELLLPRMNAFLDREMQFDYLHPGVFFGLVAATVMIGILAGTYPALLASRLSAASILKRAGLEAGGSGRLRQVLVLLQFSMLTGLIVVTGVVRLQTQFGLGQGLRFSHEQVLTINVPRSQCERSTFTDAVRALPGVSDAACEGDFLGNYGTQQYRSPDGREVTLQNSVVGPGLFELLGLVPKAGRFYERDRESDSSNCRPPDCRLDRFYPTVVNETAARTLGFADARAGIGMTFSILGGAQPGIRFEIIGVVPDFARDSVRTAIAPVMYLNIPGYRLNVKLRGESVPETLAQIDQLWKLHSPLPAPISRRFYDQYVQELYGGLMRQGRMFSVFAVLVLVLAGVGLLGLASSEAERRTREIGIRKALGAQTGDVLKLLLRQFSKPVLWANLVAWPVAAFLMHRWLAGFAYHIDLPLWLFPAAALVALAIALATVILHVLRVSREKPVQALRYE